MIEFLKNGRTAVIITLCAILAACSQTSTGSSTNSGSLGNASLKSPSSDETKLLAARKRASAAWARKKADFQAKREAARKETRKSAKKPTRKTAKNGSVRKAAIKRVAKRKIAQKKVVKKRSAKKKTKRVARKRSNKRIAKGKVQRIKRVSSAFVGGRSKGIRRNAPWRCVPGRLKAVIKQVSRKFGRVTVNSTHRSRGHNRRVGGKRGSYHLGCRAVDFRVHGRTKGLHRWLARHPYVGGFKRYRSGFYHIDTGPKRTW